MGDSDDEPGPVGGSGERPAAEAGENGPPEPASSDAGTEAEQEPDKSEATESAAEPDTEAPAPEPGETDPAEIDPAEIDDPAAPETAPGPEAEAPAGEPGEDGPAEPIDEDHSEPKEPIEPIEPGEPKSQWQQNLERGHRFNVENRPEYQYNEIQLESGRRVDSYVPGEEIVERKHSQLAEIKPDTAESYIDSLNTKYAPLQRIADTERNRELKIAGTLLEGQSILEVPPQDKPIPDEILEYAKWRGVVIRDTNRRVYS